MSNHRRVGSSPISRTTSEISPHCSKTASASSACRFFGFAPSLLHFPRDPLHRARAGPHFERCCKKTRINKKQSAHRGPLFLVLYHHFVDLITLSPYDLQISGLCGIRFDLFPNMPDMDRNGVLGAHRRFVPDNPIYLFWGKYFPSIQHQKRQDLIFQQRQRNRLAVQEHRLSPSSKVRLPMRTHLLLRLPPNCRYRRSWVLTRATSSTGTKGFVT